jgi:uncharacterized membrane protein
MKTISEYKQIAKENVQPQLFEAIIAMFIVGAIIGALSPLGVGIIVAGPLIVGLIYYFTKLRNREKATYNNLFDGFKEPLTSSIVGFVLSSIFILLWSLLFLIPGIIKCFAYKMTLYIISENPTIAADEAITQSRKMMDGNKYRLFLLYLSYIGWYLLGIFTFGLSILYIAPFIKAAELEFYHDIKNRINM